MGNFLWTRERLRLRRGGVVLGVGAFGAFALMAENGRLRAGVPLGMAFVVIAAWGACDLLGTFDDPDPASPSPPVPEVTLRAIAPRFGLAMLALCTFGASLAGAQSGIASQGLWGALVTASFVLSVVAVFGLGHALGPWARDETGAPRSLTRRHGFWIVAVAALLYLPTLGVGSLWDPWETHYGEVSREILSRDDWISLWWVQDGWFVSKPILDFWMQAIAMASLGTHYQPGQMLLGACGHIAHPEWVVRAPIVLFAILAIYISYKGVARVFGRRAGSLGAIALMTMTDWLFLSHQTMTDMPFVAPMTCAMGLLLLGLHTDQDASVRVYRIRAGRFAFGFTGWHVAFGAVLVCAVPQILYLSSRNLEIVVRGVGPYGFRPHAELFQAGSPGNCGIMPSNEACHSVSDSVLGFPPIVQALLWTALLAGLLYLNAGERRTQRLLYIGAWLFAALATMAKGPAGFALPALCVVGYLATKNRWREILRLEIVSGLLVLLLVGMPWYVAMYVRHGSYFTDQLIFHHMISRTLGHVHDTNEGDDTSFVFYVWQLGYATFPWSGLVPMGLLYWLRRGDSADRGRGDASVFLAMWFVFGFALFSFMGTKFHHYIFPAVPPLGMLVGVVLDDMVARRDPRSPDDERRGMHERVMMGGAAIAGACLLLLITRDLTAVTDEGAPGAIRLLNLFTYQYKRVWPTTLDYEEALLLFGIAAAALGAALSFVRIRRFVAMAVVGLGVAWGLFCLDVYMPRVSAHWGQRDVMAAYYTDRVSDAEPIVGYQMNWKGETFYTGNQIASFMATGTAFSTWMRQKRDGGTKVMYFVTEWSRLERMRSEVGARSYREVTDRALCNKFVLVRAEL